MSRGISRRRWHSSPPKLEGGEGTSQAGVGTSLVVQSLGIRPALWGMQVWSLVRALGSHKLWSNWAQRCSNWVHVPSSLVGKRDRRDGSKGGECRALPWELPAPEPEQGAWGWSKQMGEGQEIRRGRGDEVSTKALWCHRIHFISPVGDSASSVKEGEGRPGMLARAPVAQVSSGLNVY